MRADQEEGEVSLLRWDVKWRSRAAMGMKVSLAPFLSTGVCVLLPCSLSSLESSFPALSEFLCARRWMWCSSPLPAHGRSREALEEMQKIVAPSTWRSTVGPELVCHMSGEHHSIRSHQEWAGAHPYGWQHSSTKPSWHAEITSAWLFPAALYVWNSVGMQKPWSLKL